MYAKTGRAFITPERVYAGPAMCMTSILTTKMSRHINLGYCRVRVFANKGTRKLEFVSTEYNIPYIMANPFRKWITAVSPTCTFRTGRDEDKRMNSNLHLRTSFSGEQPVTREDDIKVGVCVCTCVCRRTRMIYDNGNRFLHIRHMMIACNTNIPGLCQKRSHIQLSVQKAVLHYSFPLLVCTIPAYGDYDTPHLYAYELG